MVVMYDALFEWFKTDVMSRDLQINQREKHKYVKN